MAAAARLENVSQSKIWQVIGASSAGTVIEWYDFYIFGSLATTMSPLFYPKGNEAFALIAYLSTFAVGFIVRPFGALFFGRIGDLVGRKVAFLVTLLLMGGSTAAVGFLPTYSQIGLLAPILLILVRVLQGLALGGEYGGAAVYVAEHVPDNRRGFYTSFIQITASLGLLISLAVIVGLKKQMSAAAFGADAYFLDDTMENKGIGIAGWRIPFMLSILLVGASLYIRLRMKESPIFQHIKATGMSSARPLYDAFANPENRRRVLISLFGATAGQAVIWYTGQFYALFYMQNVLKIDSTQASIIVGSAIVLSIPLFVVFGALSDRIGRKKLMLAGMLMGALTFFPIYKGMVHFAGNNVIGIESTKDPVTTEIKLSPVTVAENPTPEKPHQNVTSAPNANTKMLTLLIFIQLVWMTMSYAPIAAYLVEAFPARVRYTSMSLPYHIGNGIFGGLLPTIGLAACAATGNLYAGLVYPIAVALITFVIGAIYLPETHGTKIWNEVDGA